VRVSERGEPARSLGAVRQCSVCPGAEGEGSCQGSGWLQYGCGWKGFAIESG
jgi:hypothetical protein